MFDWFKRRRRKRIQTQPFPEAWEAILRRNVPYYRALPPDMQQRLRQRVQVLLAEKHFEGCGGFVITDEVRVTIAGHAACLLLGDDFDYFPELRTILVYPGIFYVEDDVPQPDGTFAEVDEEQAGQSWDLGVVVLAWNEVEASSKRAHDGYNVVLHEFAHQLDVEVSGPDGAPLLDDPALYDRWAKVMQADYERLQRDVGRGRRTVLDAYGAESPAEFFAVATETFFESAKALRAKHPALYNLLRDYYRQDPADRYEGHTPVVSD